MVVTIAVGKQACTNQQQDGNEHLQMQIPSLLSGCFYLCWCTILYNIFLVNFINPSSWLFFRTLIKKGLYFDQTLCHKISSDIVHSVYPGICHFIFVEFFHKVGFFYENNILLWYYQIRQKVVWKVHGAWIDGYHSQNKDKNITITKIRSLLFFHAVYYSKSHVISHPVIAAILNVIFFYFTTLKNNNNVPVKFSKYSLNYQIELLTANLISGWILL